MVKTDKAKIPEAGTYVHPEEQVVYYGDGKLKWVS